MDPKIVRLLLLIHLVFVFHHAKAKPFKAWIVQDEGLAPIELASYQDLISKSVYVVHAEEQGAKKRSPEIYCWVGASSSPGDAVQAIITTLTTDLFSAEHIVRGIQGELQQRESRDFMEIIKPTASHEDHPRTEDFREDVDGQKPWLAETRMILVKSHDPFGDDAPIIATLEEVAFSSEHLQNGQACLIVFNFKTVYLHCGKEVYFKIGKGNVLTRAARFAANKIMQQMSPTADVFETITDFSEKYSYLSDGNTRNIFGSDEESAREFKRRNELKRNAPFPPVMELLEKEFDEISNAKLDRQNVQGQGTVLLKPEAPIMNLKITRMNTSASGNSINEQDFTEYLKFFLSLHHDKCYIIDPGTGPFNMLVWMGEKVAPDVRKKCVEDANIIARERGSVIYIDEKHTTLQAPVLKFHPKGFIQVMERLYGSWTDIFHSVHEDPGYGRF